MDIKEKLNELNAEIKKVEAKKESKYKIDEPVLFKAGGHWVPAFVRRVIKGESVHNRIYYDLILLRPLHPGSCILHNVSGVGETQLKK